MQDCSDDSHQITEEINWVTSIRQKSPVEALHPPFLQIFSGRFATFGFDR
jgi:hypothetical protein